MRRAIAPTAAIILACFTLAGCFGGGTDHKTVIVNPPPDSHTTIDRDGNAHVDPNN